MKEGAEKLTQENGREVSKRRSYSCFHQAKRLGLWSFYTFWLQLPTFLYHSTTKNPMHAVPYSCRIGIPFLQPNLNITMLFEGAIPMERQLNDDYQWASLQELIKAIEINACYAAGYYVITN